MRYRSVKIGWRRRDLHPREIRLTAGLPHYVAPSGAYRADLSARPMPQPAVPGGLIAKAAHPEPPLPSAQATARARLQLVAKVADTKRPGCGFCGKQEHEVFCLLAGPVTSICDECVALLAAMVAEKRSAAENAT
jgi:hypothetical protein